MMAGENGVSMRYVEDKYANVPYYEGLLTYIISAVRRYNLSERDHIDTFELLNSIICRPRSDIPILQNMIGDSIVVILTNDVVNEHLVAFYPKLVETLKLMLNRFSSQTENEGLNELIGIASTKLNYAIESFIEVKEPDPFLY
jgi:hypothetical protein